MKTVKVVFKEDKSVREYQNVTRVAPEGEWLSIAWKALNIVGGALISLDGVLYYEIVEHEEQTWYRYPPEPPAEEPKTHHCWSCNKMVSVNRRWNNWYFGVHCSSCGSLLASESGWTSDHYTISCDSNTA